MGEIKINSVPTVYVLLIERSITNSSVQGYNATNLKRYNISCEL